MKRNWKNISLVLLVLLLAACTQQSKSGASTQKEKEQVVYTCPMHPQIREDHPGGCPICGMTLVKKTGQPSEQAAISLQTVLQPVNSSVISGVPTVKPLEKTIADTVRADGYLDFDTRTFNNIAARFSGRIEKLYIKYAFQEIHRGQRIMDIYSPEMVTAQQDLLFLAKNSSGEKSLIDAARQKLLLLGMTQAQIDQAIKSGKAYYSLPVYSDYDGHVHDVAHSQMPGAESPAPDFAQNLPLAVKEGMYVQKGQTLFNVVDSHRLWAILKIKQADEINVKQDQTVVLTIPDQDMTMEEHIDFIEPVLQQGDRSTSVRVYLNNHQHGMKVGSLVKAAIVVTAKSGLWLPKTAIISLGQRHIVWLKDGAAFKAHEVKTGMQTADLVQIINGLSAQDTVAANAQYLTDSDSFIQTPNHD